MKELDNKFPPIRFICGKTAIERNKNRKDPEIGVFIFLFSAKELGDGRWVPDFNKWDRIYGLCVSEYSEDSIEKIVKRIRLGHGAPAWNLFLHPESPVLHLSA